MSRNIMTVTKWIPLEKEEHKALYLKCKELKKSALELIEKLCVLTREFKFKNASKLHYNITDNEFLLLNLENTVDHTENLKEEFYKVFLKLNVDNLQLNKTMSNFWKVNLWKVKMKLCYLLQQCVSEMAYLFVYYGENILVVTIKISKVYNQFLQLDTKYEIIKNLTICSNTCPHLMYPLRKISVTKLLQILSQNRAELCCHKLIDCLLETYKFYDGHDDDNGSDNSSIEIYRALTRHMSPPTSVFTSPNTNFKCNIEDGGGFVNMDELIKYEEQNILDLVDAVLKIAPCMLGGDGIRRATQEGETTISNKTKKKVLEYYQEILWGEVGNFLEHIVLWWGSMPLSSRSPHSSQHLREWINQFSPAVDIPSVILSALGCLSDALGVHVTSTTWDEHFRLALVASKTTCNVETGKLFCEMLHDLISLSNQCEITSEWIVGAPIEELPLVEQIPILHRLDHSIHTTRLWALNETRKLANNWNVESFFMIIRCDIDNCLTKLNSLRLVEHTAETEKRGLDVHVQVCVNMREKLVSEVNLNVQKLKEAPSQCVDCLASVCRTISLANLQMIFPEASFWRIDDADLTRATSAYVEKFLERILTPVLAATEDSHISNMILKIMCEAWLDHIYIHRIKFSHYGAIQLLTDFAFVSTWILNCPVITQTTRRKMLKNEVLRRCEGVGRLLLRSPGEHIKMNEKNALTVEDSVHSPTSDNVALMPPEMYVPNQEEWLELRASQRRLFILSLCCGELTIRTVKFSL